MAKVQAGLLTAALQFVAGAGGDPIRVRAAAGLRAGDLLDAQRMLDAEMLAKVLSCAADDLGTPGFGLELGAKFDFDGLGLLGYAVLNAPTVAVGLNNLVRFVGILVDGSDAHLVVRKGIGVLKASIRGVTRATARHLHEGGMVVILRMVRHLVGDPNWRPLAIGFAHPRPQRTAEHVEVFGVEPTFGGSVNEIRFDASILGREVRHADRTLLPIVEQRLQEVLTSAPGEDPWLATLRIQIAGRLCDGHPKLSDVAPDVGLTARTLQRRLADRGVVYRDLVQQARQCLALEYLEHGDTDLTEIAFLLGYSEQSAFSHAFRRWTGRSPGAQRRSGQARG